MLDGGCQAWLVRLGAADPPSNLLSGVTPLTFSRPYDPDSPGQRLDMAKELAGMARAVRPDVIHAGPVPCCGHVAAMAGLKPLLAVSWGSDILLDSAVDSTVAGTTRHVLTVCDAFLGDCMAVIQAAQEISPLDNKLVEILPWGIDIETFKPRMGTPASILRSPAWHDKTVIFSPRSWEPVYGVFTVLIAFNIARQRMPELHLVLAGAGSLETEIRIFLRKNHLEQHVTIPGYISQDHLPAYYQAADIYCSASFSDGTSVSLLEALASGLPVVVSNLPSNREWVSPGVNGWLAAAGNPQDFASRLLDAALLSPKAREDMARSNRRLATERANWKANQPRLFSLYAALARRTA